MSARRLLTFNWHESYLHLLSGVGYEWDVVPRPKAGRSDWWHEVRPVPRTMRLVTPEHADVSLVRGDYDAVVCHNTQDLQAVIDTGVPTITVFHTSRVLEQAFGLDVERWRALALPLLRRSTLVFVSAAKQASWGLGGAVIPPGIDLSDYGGYTGEQCAVLNVGNLKCELAAVNGLEALERATAGLPLTLRGLNPHLPGSRLSESWDELRATMRSHRVYLNTTHGPYEDGYNLAMLEAMATGMPVVTLANPTSPIQDGINGYSSDRPDVLRERILELLEDHERALMLGTMARETVAVQFPIERFGDRWRTVIEAAATGARPGPPSGRGLYAGPQPHFPS